MLPKIKVRALVISTQKEDSACNRRARNPTFKCSVMLPRYELDLIGPQFENTQSLAHAHLAIALECNMALVRSVLGLFSPQGEETRSLAPE